MPTVVADPLAALVSRALGREVEDVAIERVRREEEVAGAETQRIAWRAGAATGSLLFRRYPATAALEPALLPLLARRGAPVPAVFASGVPPRHAAESRPWLLMQDPGGRAATRSETSRAVAAARAAIARDHTTLVSLGVPALSPARIRDEALLSEELLEADEFARVRRLAAEIDLERLGSDDALVHGALDLGNAFAADRGAVLVGWSRAHFGSPLLDEPGPNRDAQTLATLFAIRWYTWEAREMLRARPRAASLVRQALARYN